MTSVLVGTKVSAATALSLVFLIPGPVAQASEPVRSVAAHSAVHVSTCRALFPGPWKRVGDRTRCFAQPPARGPWKRFYR